MTNTAPLVLGGGSELFDLQFHLLTNLPLIHSTRNIFWDRKKLLFRSLLNHLKIPLGNTSELEPETYSHI
uniref:Uncharacterized protein n=1 Tax=Triticum urartu TaxID=4572 RepID=A0A8R7RD58_TRIUA